MKILAIIFLSVTSIISLISSVVLAYNEKTYIYFMLISVAFMFLMAGIAGAEKEEKEDD